MKELLAKGWSVTWIIMALAFLFCASVQAHVYVVTDTNDTTSVTSLRGAVIEANARGGENTIVLGEEADPRRHEPPRAWTFYLTISGADEDAAQTGDLDITAGNLTIVGATTNVAINATGLKDRVFHVWPGARLELENLVITGGGQVFPVPAQPQPPPIVIIQPIAPIQPIEPILPISTNLPISEPPPVVIIGPISTPVITNPPPVLLPGPTNLPITLPVFLPTEPPGGVVIVGLNAQTLSKSAAVQTSPALPEGGGGILNAGTLVLRNCVIESNSTFASDGGGGIFNTGHAEIADCYFSGNLAFGADGGAIYNNGSLTMSGCIINSNSTGVILGGNGGGIYNDVSGTVELHDCKISGNRCADAIKVVTVASGFSTTGGSGGGLCNAGLMTLDRCQVSGNSCGGGAANVNGEPGSTGGSGGNGGGINNLGTLTIEFSTVSDNIAGSGAFAVAASNGGAGGHGGGIYNASNLVMICCTVSGNFAGAGGSPATFLVETNSIGIGGVGGDGGGIYNAGGCLLNSSTIVSNSAGAGGIGNPGENGGMGGNGGGVYDASGGLSANIENTLIALNVIGAGGAGGSNIVFSPSGQEPPPPFTNIFAGQSGPAGMAGSSPDVFGLFNSQGFNLIGAADGSTGFTSGVHADQVGTILTPIDPLIGPLQMNGGPTATHALLTGSSAIDKGNSFGIHQDQRGESRPFNYLGIPNAVGGDGSDIGAFELHAGERFEPPCQSFGRR